MAEFVDAWPTARKRHRCGMCRRWIGSGEEYWRQAGFDAGRVWTNKTCGHCERVVWAYGRVGGDSEWELEWVLEWLEDGHPAVFAQAFNMPIDDRQACVFVEPGVIDQLQSMVAPAVN